MHVPHQIIGPDGSLSISAKSVETATCKKLRRFQEVVVVVKALSFPPVGLDAHRNGGKRQGGRFPSPTRGSAGCFIEQPRPATNGFFSLRKKPRGDVPRAAQQAGCRPVGRPEAGRRGRSAAEGRRREPGPHR